MNFTRNRSTKARIAALRLRLLRQKKSFQTQRKLNSTLSVLSLPSLQSIWMLRLSMKKLDANSTAGQTSPFRTSQNSSQSLTKIPLKQLWDGIRPTVLAKASPGLFVLVFLSLTSSPIIISTKMDILVKERRFGMERTSFASWGSFGCFTLPLTF